MTLIQLNELDLTKELDLTQRTWSNSTNLIQLSELDLAR